MATALAVSDQVFTQREVCRLLRISKKTLQNWRKSGLVPFTRMGSRIVRIRCSDLPEPYRGDLVKSLVESVERAEGGAPSPVVTFEPDPILTADAGQFFTVQLLDHLETCCEEGCQNETRVAVRFSDGERSYDIRAMCKDHIHCEYANWMVGV